jgi:hypothetical protein
MSGPSVCVGTQTRRATHVVFGGTRFAFSFYALSTSQSAVSFFVYHTHLMRAHSLYVEKRRCCKKENPSPFTSEPTCAPTSDNALDKVNSSLGCCMCVSFCYVHQMQRFLHSFFLWSSAQDVGHAAQHHQHSWGCRVVFMRCMLSRRKT